MKKTVLIISLFALIVLQYRLWFADDGLLKAFHLKRIVGDLQAKNASIAKQNVYLAGEINVLKKGGTAIENRARSDLGMVKKGEVFYQVVK
jgi:Septum formation initiator